MDIINMYMVSGEQVTLKDYDQKREVYEIKYRDKEGIKTKQLYADTKEFKEAFETYEAKLERVFASVKKDVEPFFQKAYLKRNLIASPGYLAFILSLAFSAFQPPEVIGIPVLLGGIAVGGASFILANAPIISKGYTIDNVKRYVTDENVSKAFENIFKKLYFAKKIGKKYSEVFAEIDRKTQLEEEKSKKLEQQKRAQEARNRRKERDFLEYQGLSLEDRKRYYRLAKLTPREHFKPDTPSFIRRENELFDEQDKNFKEFAIKEFGNEEEKRKSTKQNQGIQITSLNPSIMTTNTSQYRVYRTSVQKEVARYKRALREMQPQTNEEKNTIRR